MFPIPELFLNVWVPTLRYSFLAFEMLPREYRTLLFWYFLPPKPDDFEDKIPDDMFLFLFQNSLAWEYQTLNFLRYNNLLSLLPNRYNVFYRPLSVHKSFLSFVTLLLIEILFFDNVENF